VSTLAPELIRNCRRCGRELNLGALACDHCHALVYSQELDRLADEAKVLEAKGQPRQAREQWLMGLRLLPPNSTQAIWITQHARDLELTNADAEGGHGSQIQSATKPAPRGDDHPWAKRLGPLGPLAIFLAKAKFFISALLKLKFLFSFVAFFGLYWALYGAKFGIGFAVLILIHEMGHYIDVKRRGLPADLPVFLPGFGAYVRWQALGVSLETRAAVALAGPLAGFLASLACAAVWWQTGSLLWAALARTSAVLNLLNLIPVPILDGGHAALALDKGERLTLLATCLILWLSLGESFYIFVALGAGYQAFFAGNFPSHPSVKTTAYFVAVLTAFGLLLRLLPGHGFNMR
jgi:Zn-dependent protease